MRTLDAMNGHCSLWISRMINSRAQRGVNSFASQVFPVLDIFFTYHRQQKLWYHSIRSNPYERGLPKGSPVNVVFLS